VKWSFLTGGPIISSPAIGADGTLYVGSDDYNLYALDSLTGTKKWSFAAGSFVHSSPALGLNHTLYVSTSQNLYALDARTGAQKWSVPIGSSGPSSIAVGQTGLVYYAGGTKFYALDGATGHTLWSLASPETLHAPIYASPALAADGTVYIALDDYLYALDGISGATKWAYNFPKPSPNTMEDVGSAAIGADGTVFVASRHLYAFSGQTGALIWKTADLGSCGDPVVSQNGTVYIPILPTSQNGVLYAFDAGTGTVKWQFRNNSTDESSLAFGSAAIGIDGTVYCGSLDATLYAIR